MMKAPAAGKTDQPLEIVPYHAATLQRLGVSIAMADKATQGFNRAAGQAKAALAFSAPYGIPDHVSIDPASAHYWPQYKHLGVRIDGRERLGDVHEFCVSEGWALVRSKGPDGRPYSDGNGHYATERIEGLIEPYMKKPLPGHKTLADAERINAAEEKRRRKAAKRAKHG